MDGKYTQEILEHESYIRNCARKLLRDYTRADDLTQITMERALKFQHTFDGRYIKGWLYRILYTQCVNEWNKIIAENEKSAGFEQELANSQMKIVTIKDRLDSTAIREQIIQTIENLPEAYRDTAYYIFIEERPYEEVARLFDCPIGTVMSRVNRARKLLQEALSELGIEYGLQTPDDTE